MTFTISEIENLTEKRMEATREINELVRFMQGPDNVVLVRLISFFSTPILPINERAMGDTYLHPRELKPFWDSLNAEQKHYYRMLVGFGFI